MYKVSQMNPTLEYIYNHPKETKRIIGITYEQLINCLLYTSDAADDP